MRRKFVLFLVWALVVASAGAVLIEPGGAQEDNRPSAPRLVRASSTGVGDVTVTWAAPASNGGSPITGYIVTTGRGGTAEVTLPTTNPSELLGAAIRRYVVEGLDPGGAYTFTVHARNTSGTPNGPGASISFDVPPSRPDAPTAVGANEDDREVTVTWTAPASNGGSRILYYTVTASVGDTAPVAASISTRGTSCPTCTTVGVTFTGLTPGSEYKFRVTATNSVGTSAPSEAGPQDAVPIPATVPSAPRSVSTIGTARDAVTITWMAPASTGGSPITGYTLTISRTAGDTTSLVPGDGDGDDVEDGTVMVTALGDAAARSHTFSGLTAGSAYKFTVAATNNTGGETGTDSAPGASASITFTGQAYVPNAPVAPVASAALAPADVGDVTVTWEAPADNGAPITGYTVTAARGDTTSMLPDPIDTSGMSDPTGTKVTFTGLTPGGIYTFTVTATNRIGTSKAATADPGDVTIPPGKPGAPTAVTATVVDDDVTVTWTAPASNGGSKITGYDVAASGDGTSSEPDTMEDVTDTMVTFTDLDPGSYTFTVTAFNDPDNDPDMPDAVTRVKGVTSEASATVTVIEAMKTFNPVATGDPVADGAVDEADRETVMIPIVITTEAGEADNYPSVIKVPPAVAVTDPDTSDVEVVSGVDLLGVVSGVSVTLHDVQHGSFRDLDILLVAPDGTNSILMTDVGGTSDLDNVDLTFTAGAQQLSDVGTIVSGTYAPTKGTAAGGDCEGFCGPDVSKTSDEASLAVFNGLDPNGEWKLYVYDDRGIVSGQIDSWTLHLTIRDDVPDAPRAVRATASDDGVRVRWLPPASNGGDQVTSYTVTAMPSDATMSTSDTIDTSTMTCPTCTTVMFTGLDAGATYTFMVTATNDIGTGGASAASAAVMIQAGVPGAPTAVTATAGDDVGEVTVKWMAPADGGAPIMSYTVTAMPGGATMSTSDTWVTFTGLDAGGSYTFMVTATNDIGTGEASAASAAVSATSGQGYFLVDESGIVYPFGPDAENYGDLAHVAAAAVTDIEVTPSGQGYWLVAADGAVFAFGDAVDYGGWTPDSDERVTGISGTPDGGGYWLFSDKGRVRAFGNAVSFGDLQGMTLDGPVIDAIATISGNGYWMLGSDGGVFAFGDARYYGSIPEVLPGVTLDGPTVGLVPTPSGHGYWMVAADGGVFAFGDAGFVGSLPGYGITPTMPITGMVAFFDGYLMLGTDGGVFNFSSAPFYGSLGAHSPLTPVLAPVIGIAAIG